MYLLGTDIVSNFRKSRPHPNLLDWMGRIADEEVAVSVMTVFEIQSGAHLVRAAAPAKAAEIEAWLDGFVLAGGFAILPLGTEAARLYAAMFVTPSLKSFLLPHPRSKAPKSGVDLIIAAIAIVGDACVVTTNTADYLRIHREFPLPGLYDPLAGSWFVTPPDAGAAR